MKENKLPFWLRLIEVADPNRKHGDIQEISHNEGLELDIHCATIVKKALSKKEHFELVMLMSYFASAPESEKVFCSFFKKGDPKTILGQSFFLYYFENTFIHYSKNSFGGTIFHTSPHRHQIEVWAKEFFKDSKNKDILVQKAVDYVNESLAHVS